MVQYLLALLDSSLVLIERIALSILPNDSFLACLELNVPSPLPRYIWMTRVVGETPHWMHGTHFRSSHRSTSEAGEAGRSCPTELGVERIENPDIVLRIGEYVDVHLLEHMER